MRKSVLTVLLFALICMCLLSCSDGSQDPRVSPTKVFIVNIEDAEREVKYDPMYGMRVVYMHPFETLQLEAVTNRLYTEADLHWTSNATGVATVDETGLVLALPNDNNGASALISVGAKAGKDQAVCLVIVTWDIPGEDSKVNASVQVHVDPYTPGTITQNGEKVILSGITVEELAQNPIEFEWSCEGSFNYSKFVWEINGVKVDETKTPTWSYAFDKESYGRYNVTCHAYRMNVQGNEHLVGSAKTRVEIYEY